MKRGSSSGYSRVENEDPEEAKHRRAQFLIYKAMQKADHRRSSSSSTSRPSWLRVKIFKLKIRIGKRFKSLRKRLLTNSVFSGTRADLWYKQVACVFKSCKGLLHAKQVAAGNIVRTLPSHVSSWGAFFIFYKKMSFWWWNLVLVVVMSSTRKKVL